MFVTQRLFAVTVLLTGLVGVSGCSTMEPRVAEADELLRQKQDEITSLEASRQELEKNLAARDVELARQTQMVAEAQQATRVARASSPDTMSPASAGKKEELLPPNAKAGECYARVLVPPTYRTETERVVKREASERIETIPARYESADDRIMVKAASERLEVIPATYAWVEERVLVKAASSRIETVPPVYETVTERVLDQPAHTVWKKGRGPLQRIDHSTGEIVCLVEIPATYKTVSKRILKHPASTRTVVIPAQYKTVKKRVVKTPASTRTVVVPAEYQTLKVRKLVSDARTQRIPVPVEYQTVSRRVQVTDARMEWRPILCQTNASRQTVMTIQRALLGAGHHPGPIDGVIGTQTMRAVEAFQKRQGLSVGNLTMETLRSLGVRMGEV